jgi:DNA polymerase-3 subunit alpha
MGIQVLPPDVNESQARFSVHGGAIRYGLAGVKNVGMGAIESIVAGREKCGGFMGMLDFCEQMDGTRVNRRVVESLVKAGSFDSLNRNRAQLLRSVETALDRAARVLKDRLSGQMGLFGSGGKQRTDDRFEDCTPWSSRERFENEKEVLGFFLTGHPLEQYMEQARKFADHDSLDLKDIPITRQAGRGVDVRLAGIVTTRKYFDTSKGRMAKCRLEDLKGSVQMVVFSQVCEKCEEKLRSDEPLLVVGHARREEDSEVDVIAQDMYYLRDAEKIMSREAHFSLRADLVAREQLEGLKRLIARFPGRCRPVIHLDIPGKSVVTCRLSDKYLVDPNDELVEEAKRIFGIKVLSLR